MKGMKQMNKNKRYYVHIEAYVVNYLLKGQFIDNSLFISLSTAINDSIYRLKGLTYKVDQIKIYKNGILIAELNK